MKTLSEYLSDKLLTPAFNITRVSMPQIHDQDDFKKHLDTLGITYMQHLTDLNNVKPVQIDVDQNKIDSIDPTQQGKPVIVSDAYYILDGHHRFFAHVAHDMTHIEVLYVDETINRLLALANNYLQMKTEPDENRIRPDYNETQ